MPWGGSFKNIPGDAEVRVEVREGVKCICPAAPFECGWLDCLTDCKACKRRRAS